MARSDPEAWPDSEAWRSASDKPGSEGDRQIASARRRSVSKVRLAALASSQHGRVGTFQLKALGIGDATIGRWMKAGYLHRVLPGVYAVGHDAPSIEAALTGALLYAGPGAMLSHMTALWWRGLHQQAPEQIHLSTPRRCTGQPGIQVHPRRALERVRHRELPVTSLEQTLLDVAATEPFDTLRKALADAEYRGWLDLELLAGVLGAGRRGSSALNRALEIHQPRLARTRSRLERKFIALCERYDLPMPDINVRLHGFEVDALWRAEGVVVELDGAGNHRTRAQITRDRRRDLKLRAAGFWVVRYSEDQIDHDAEQVVADLRALLSAAAEARRGAAWWYSERRRPPRA